MHTSLTGSDGVKDFVALYCNSSIWVLTLFVGSFIKGMLKALIYIGTDAASVVNKSDSVRDFPNESAFSSQNAVLTNKLHVLIGDLCRVDPEILLECAVGCNLFFRLLEYNEWLTLLIK